MIQLGLDEALLRIHNNCTSALDVFTQVSECLKCPTVYRATALASNWSDVTLNTKYDSIVEVKLTNGDRICTMPHSGYEDHGSYQLDVYETQLDGRYDCQLRQIESGRNGTLPFILIVLLYAILITGYTIGKKLYKVYLTVNSSPNVSHYDQIPEADIEEDTTEVCEASPLIVQSSDRSTPQPARHRLQGLDSFRGLTILLMIYVNYGGGGYSMLAHKPWFGLTIADTIFPCFIFIMGISVALSVRKQVVAKEPFKSVVCQMIRRSVNLFLLGLMINSIKQTSLAKLRVPGVLQRVSVSYLFVALVHYVNLRQIENPYVDLTAHWRLCTHMLMFWLEWLIMLLLAIVYLYFTLLWEYSDQCPLGYQGPGGLHDNAAHFNCTGGSANVLDQIVFGVSHIYTRSTAAKIYSSTMPHDPEGFLGTVTSIILTFLGLEAGKVLLSFPRPRDRLIHWFTWALVLASLGSLLTVIGIPIVKNLWSLSYIFVTGSLGFTLMALMYSFIDLTRSWSGYPFSAVGQNSILLYTGHELLRHVFPFYYDVDETSHYMLLIRNSIATTIWLLVAMFLAKKRIFVTV